MLAALFLAAPAFAESNRETPSEAVTKAPVRATSTPVPDDMPYEMPYEIKVDYTNQITTVYDSVTGEIVRQMICSAGEEGSEFAEGVYYLPANARDTDRTEWAYIHKYNCYVKYVTRIKGGYLFHSVPFHSKKLTKLDSYAWYSMGSAVSHGCIRLVPEDAEWIAKNCLEGTRVTIYRSNEVDEELRQSLALGVPGEQYGDYSLDAPEKYKLATVTEESGATLFSGKKSGGESIYIKIPLGSEVYVTRTDKYYYHVKYQYLTGVVPKKHLEIVE